MSTDCDSFFDAYGCVFRNCRGYQAPLPLVRLAPVAHAVDGGVGGGNVGRLEEMVAVGLDRNTKHAATARLMQLNFGVAEKCASFLQLLSRRRLPIALDPAVHYVRQLVSGPAMCGLVSSSSSSSSSSSLAAYTAALYRTATQDAQSPSPCDASGHKSATRVERVVLRETGSLALASGTLWCVGGDREKGRGTGASGEDGGAAHVMQLGVDALFDRGGGRGGVGALWALPLPWPGAQTAAIVELLAGGAVAAVLGGYEVVFADARQPACRSAAVRLAPPSSPPRTRPNGGPALCSGGLAASHYLVCGFDDHTLRVYDQRRITSAAPLLELRCGRRVDVRARAVCGAALLLSSTQVGILDLTSLHIHAAQTLADGNVLDAALFDVGDGIVEVCTTSTSGMVYHLRMRQ